MIDEKLKEEIKAFILEEREIETVKGHKLKIKPLSWKKELVIIKAIGELIEILTGSENVENIDLQNIGISNIISSLCEKAPELLTEIVCVLIEKDKEFVENELLLEDIINISQPILENIISRLKKILLNQILPMVKKAFQTEQINQNQ